MLARLWILVYPFLFYSFLFSPLWNSGGEKLWSQILQVDYMQWQAIVFVFAIFCMSVAILVVPFTIVYYTLKWIEKGTIV